MHFQKSEPNWPDALLLMPDYAVIKAFDASLLREAKQKWAAAGRDPARLFTVFRHFDLQTTPRTDWDGALAHWEFMFPRFADATYYDQYAPFVDFVQGANEYTATSTWQDPADAAWAIQNDQAMARVWNRDYRGQRGIPAHCAVTLLSGPVSNDVPRGIFELSIIEDCPIDYHAYTRYWQGTRFSLDWQHDSGRWDFHERAYGLRPRWLFGESGPYINTENGWRHPDVLNGNVASLEAAMRAWWADIATTPAYREGRIIGPGSWFTSGHVGWQFYQLETSDLMVLARAAAEMWKPGTGDDMADLAKVKADAEQVRAEAAQAKGRLTEVISQANAAIANQNAIIAKADAIIAEVTPPPWWDQPVPYTFQAQPNPSLQLYKDDKLTVAATLNYTGWTINVVAVDPAGWLLVVDKAGTADDRWIKASDVTPV